MSDYTVPLIIDGEPRVTAQTLAVTSPDTGAEVHRSSVASAEDAVAAVSAAAAAGRAWRATPPPKRRDILLRAAALMEERRDALAGYFTAEVGAARAWADFNLDVAVDMLKDVAGRVRGCVAGAVPACDDPNLGAMILKEPYGVVLAMAPWNAPYILGTRSVVFPIAAGCTVVFKGSESCPRVMHGLASVLIDAGLPKGVLNFIVSDAASAPAVTGSLIAHPEVKKINFTGSTDAPGVDGERPQIIGKMAGEQLKPVVLELGGKAPAIVWEDANLEIAAQQCALGAFLFGGQICMSTERIILINSQGVEKNKKLLKDAAGKGATLLNGDFNAEESSKTRMRPIVVKKVTPDMDLYKQESFGPSVSLVEVETEEEALRIANDTEYGLTSAVFTEDLRTGLRFAKGIESGAVHINNMTVHDEMALPHGGAKASGYGRFNGSYGLEEWVRTKTITWRN